MKIFKVVRGLSASVLLAGPLVGAPTDSAQSPPPPVTSEYAFTAKVQVGEPLVVDRTPNGIRRFIPITGGTFSGPHLKGVVLGAGGDSQLIRSDGIIEVEARYMLKTDDNVLIAVVNRGLRRAPPAVMARLMKGEHVAREEYYFRTVAQFEAPLNSRYADLNGSIFVGTAEREPSAAIVHYYRVL
jgi:Protein of unknown function (DUF3237)